MDWIFKQADTAQAKELSLALNINPAICACLIQIDSKFADPAEAELFLKPRLANLDDGVVATKNANRCLYDRRVSRHVRSLASRLHHVGLQQNSLAAEPLNTNSDGF